MNYNNFQETDFKVIISGEKFVPFILNLENKTEFESFAFSENENSYCCLLPVENTTENLPVMNGLSIKYEQFKKIGSSKSDYILIECNSKAYLSNFTLMLKEILCEYDNSNYSIEKSLNKVISRWRHFLSLPRLNILPEDEIIGLIGELLLLEKFLINDPSDSLVKWVANKGEEDFISNQNVIEVKATLKGKHEHIINGIDQLQIQSNRTKTILSLLLNNSKSHSSFSLPQLIEKCEKIIENSPDQINLLYEKLRKRGYDPRDSDLYENFQFDLIRGGYFKVDEFFPKLTTLELKESLSSRISKVRYTIDMEGLDNLDFTSTNINLVLKS
jgi:hypothetical protein